MPNTVFEQNLQKNVKSDHHHRILHFRYGLGTKFQRKMSTNFWTKLIQKRYI